MTTETKTFKVEAYRNDEGEPCCAANFNTGDVCIFYRTSRFGCTEECIFDKGSSFHHPSLKRRKGGEGTLIPSQWCPIWPIVEGVLTCDEC